MSINRNPAGKFIAREAMLSAWLPLMLTWMHCEQLPQLLKIAARWCELRAATDLEIAVGNIRHEGILADDDRQPFTVYKMSGAQRWFQRRDILLDALKRLAEVK